MDSFQFWLYVIIAVIYVISRVMKRSNQQRRAERPQTPSKRKAESDYDGGQPTGEHLPPMSFEELLREITEGKKKAQPVSRPKPLEIPAPERPKPAYIDYDDDIGSEEKSLETIDYDTRRQETTTEIYERAKRDATLRTSLQELRSTIGESKSGRFESFKIEDKNTLLKEYVKELRNPTGFKKAVVLSEILKPKF
jgi:hypothetical protein